MHDTLDRIDEVDLALSRLPASQILQMFSELYCLAQVLPATSGALRPPWEVIESNDYPQLEYRATRAIPVFGSHLSIPPGTCGRMVSQPDQMPVIVVWQLAKSVSGWLPDVADITCCFAV